MMSSTNEEDPFLQVQADVLHQLNQIRPLFTSYLRIRSLSLTTPSSTTTPSTEPSPELLSARKDLQTALTTLSEDLADLVASVAAVQSDPYKYGLEIEEVARRKRLVDEVGAEVEGMREELARSTSAAPSQQSQGGGGKGKGPAGRPGRFEEDEGRGDEDYAAQFEHEQQLTMLREQDTALDSVFHTVGNLRQQADDMGRELEEQAGMLEVTDQLADRVGGRLQTGMTKMKEVVRRNEDGLSSCCIAVLIFVLILLLILVLIL